MNGLRIARDLSLPIEYATDAAAIVARRGAGKTYTGAVIAEELVKASVPFVALDPMGALSGLRSSADGKQPGLPVTILGGEHGDAPLDRTSGKIIADLVVDQPSWYILDLNDLDTNAAQDQFAMDFAERLYRRKAPAAMHTPLHLIIDEADSFAPQRAKGQERMLGAFEAIARRGRIRGLGSTWITQRPAVLNKNVLTQAEVLICLQITSPQDRAAVDEWAKGHSDDEERKAFLGQLASLKRGEAWVWSPSLDLFRKVQIRKRETFDSSHTPKAGERAIVPQRLADINVDALRASLAEQIEKVEANDPKKLKARVAELERKLAAAEQEHHVEPEVVTVEVPVLPEGVFLPVESVVASLDRIGAELAAVREGVVPILDHVREQVEQAVAAVPKAVRPAPRVATSAPKVHIPPRPITSTVPVVDVTLDKAMRSVLTVLAQYDGRTRRQLAMLAGYSWSGGFRNTLSALRSAGLMVGGNQSVMRITPGGLAALGDTFEVLPEGPALLDYWLAKLDGPESKILRYLVDVYPSDVPGPELAASVSKNNGEPYEWSGGFRNYLSAMRTLELIVGSNAGMHASDALMAAIA